MDRLTKRLHEGKAICIKECEKECVEGYYECHKCKPFANVLKKLADYEDAEEQRSRIKPNDTVWVNYFGQTSIAEVTSISINSKGVTVMLYLDPDTYEEYDIEDVYKSEEEAEQALKQIGE